MGDGIREFCETNGYDEREVRDIVESCFRMVRWCISVGSMEFKLKWVGGFEYCDPEDMKRHIMRMRKKIEYDREVDYNELMESIERSIERKKEKWQKKNRYLRDRFGEEYDDKKAKQKVGIAKRYRDRYRRQKKVARERAALLRMSNKKENDENK